MGRQICRLAAPAIVAADPDSPGHIVDRRWHFQLFAGAGTLDAPARTRFVRAGPAIPRKADGAGARLDRTQMDRASTREKRTVIPLERVLDSVFALAAARGVTQKPTPLINQRVRCDW